MRAAVSFVTGPKLPEMDSKRRDTIRNPREQLLTLVNNWDPAGKLAAGAPRNEYDAITEKIYGLLSGGASREEVARLLESEIREDFGASPKDVEQFVNRAFAWFDLTDRDE